jgi:hypothetical protein
VVDLPCSISAYTQTLADHSTFDSASQSSLALPPTPAHRPTDSQHRSQHSTCSCSWSYCCCSHFRQGSEKVEGTVVREMFSCHSSMEFILISGGRLGSGNVETTVVREMFSHHSWMEKHKPCVERNLKVLRCLQLFKGLVLQ